MTHFHVTAASRVPSILARGLVTDADGWDAGYSWFFDDRAIALAAIAPGQTWGGTRDLVVLEVDLTGLPVVPDPHPGWGDHRDAHAFAVTCPVEPERVRCLTR